jgi:hypothetical protein
MNAQSELVEHKSASEPAHKIFHGANGVELPYWEEDGKIIRIAVSDTIAVDVTNPKGGGNRVGSRLLFLAEFLESGIGAQRVPRWIEP